MNKKDFKKKVLKIYYKNNITISEAIGIAKNKYSISDEQFKRWFL